MMAFAGAFTLKPQYSCISTALWTWTKTVLTCFAAILDPITLTLTIIHDIRSHHIWTLISYSTPDEAHDYERVALVKKEKMRWNCKRSKRSYKNHNKLLTEIIHERLELNTFNRYSFTFNGGLRKHCKLAFVHAELRAREAGSFCHFWKVTSRISTAIYSFFTQANVNLLFCLV